MRLFSLSCRLLPTLALAALLAGCNSAPPPASVPNLFALEGEQVTLKATGSTGGLLGSYPVSGTATFNGMSAALFPLSPSGLAIVLTLGGKASGSSLPEHFTVDSLRAYLTLGALVPLRLELARPVTFTETPPNYYSLSTTMILRTSLNTASSLEPYFELLTTQGNLRLSLRLQDPKAASLPTGATLTLTFTGDSVVFSY